MFRALLSILLMALLALPHGMCFCHYFEAPAESQPADFSLDEQARPASQPLDDHEHDDCPCCKLRHVACVSSPVAVTDDGAPCLFSLASAPTTDHALAG